MRCTLPIAPCLIAALVFGGAASAAPLTVKRTPVDDEKAVFATVESANVVPARARIGGTVADLLVTEGDTVAGGQAIARVGDEKLVLQLQALDADISAALARQRQAQTEYNRAKDLFDRGTVPKARLDDARTALSVANNALKARQSQRDVVEQQLGEGEVLTPTAGRVLQVPVTPGTVILPGETVAMIADEATVLRLRIPERHARVLKLGDEVRLASSDLGATAAATGRIKLIYPEIEDGRVIADAEVSDIGGYFVGERVRVYLSAGERESIVIPAAYIKTHFGVDYVMLVQGEAEKVPVPVQLGQESTGAGGIRQVEILSGLADGDVIDLP